MSFSDSPPGKLEDSHRKYSSETHKAEDLIMKLRHPSKCNIVTWVNSTPQTLNFFQNIIDCAWVAEVMTKIPCVKIGLILNSGGKVWSLLKFKITLHIQKKKESLFGIIQRIAYCCFQYIWHKSFACIKEDILGFPDWIMWYRLHTFIQNSVLIVITANL